MNEDRKNLLDIIKYIIIEFKRRNEKKLGGCVNESKIRIEWKLKILRSWIERIRLNII